MNDNASKLQSYSDHAKLENKIEKYRILLNATISETKVILTQHLITMF